MSVLIMSISVCVRRQVMQQKSHEILVNKCGMEGAMAATEAEAAEAERQTRRLLAATEEALTGDWPAARQDHLHHHHHHHHLDIAAVTLHHRPES